MNGCLISKKELNSLLNLSSIKIIVNIFLNFYIEKKGVWMGGLLFPEAYMTATR